MSSPRLHGIRLGRAMAAIGLVSVFLMILVYPHLGRLRSPSLYSDDVVRVFHLQTTPLSGLLFRPFNEHMAPAFEVVSWLTWRLAGKKLEAAPLAYTVASFLPFALSMLLLGLVVLGELGSLTTALATVALFGLSSVHSEAVYWYSASSFTWALLWTLVTLLVVRPADGSGGQTALRLGVATLAAAFAPMYSAIGLLAGPLGTLRALAASPSPGRGRDRAGAIAPMLGTLAYLALCSAFRYRDVLTESLDRNVDFRVGLVSIARGPIDVLVPGLLGVGNLDWALASGLDLVLFGLSLAAVLSWACSSRHRPLVLCGLLMILGGYALTYLVRTTHGSHWILEVQRYHLFPQAGLVLLLSPALRLVLRRFDATTGLALRAATLVAAVILVAHLPAMNHHARSYHFPDQRPTLVALDRLDAICRARGITRIQVLTALDPIRRRWFPHDFNALMLLASSVEVPQVTDALVRPTLLAALTPIERVALCGGMDATRHLRPASEIAGAAIVAEGQLVRSLRFRPPGPEGCYVPAGAPAILEFRMIGAVGPLGGEARALSVPVVGASERPLEVWWAGPDEEWSEARSVRWRTDPGHPAQDWAVMLDRLPHWDPARTRRIRLIVRVKGPHAVGTPRLLR